jgi:hypothetical protein
MFGTRPSKDNVSRVLLIPIRDYNVLPVLSFKYYEFGEF